MSERTDNPRADEQASGGGPKTPQIRNTPPPPPPKRKGESRPYYRSLPKASAKPRRVRGGVKLKTKEGETPESWITQRINRVIEDAATGEPAREGLEYARAGQTKRIEVEAGEVRAVVQGRMPKAYLVDLSLQPFSSGARDELIRVMSDQALYAAKLLAGEVPPNIEDLFAPLGLKLYPTEPGEIRVSCTCADWSSEKPWCKHAVCTGMLLGERLGDDPFTIFDLRGIGRDELLDRLRDQRALAGQGPGASVVYQAHVPGASDTKPAPLEESIDRYWEVGAGLDTLETPIARPDASHVLLRRLGPSPFTEGRFPLMGLLATCYELISEDAAKAREMPEGDEPETE
ncbi:MAG: hypothetical protein ACF8Q5_09645 [Phycisphaerales bacterium JB040]